jgi:HD-GYP domain-containing protein (c-di-GMP phosphodiesterase class II)
MLAELVTTPARTGSPLCGPDNFAPDAECYSQEPAVQTMRRFAASLGLPLWCITCGDAGLEVIAASGDGLALIPNVPLSRFRDLTGPSVWAFESGLTFYSLPLPRLNGTPAVALGWLPLRPDRRPDDLVLAAVEAGWTKQRVDDWLRSQPYATPEVIERLLSAVWSEFQLTQREERLRSELINAGEQIERTYEEITLLQTLTGKLKLTLAPTEVVPYCLQRVRELTEGEGAAIWFEDHTKEFHFLKDGVLPFDERGLASLCRRCDRKDWSRPFVKNHIDTTPLANDFPGLRNFILCAVGDPGEQFGWMIHCNHPQEFGSVQAGLLQSIARILGTHLHNQQLFQENEDLVMGFVRSMVSTIDAKDSYTRGHSERVAIVSGCLARELGLSKSDVSDIYLSGLLHDIGKVGVDDRILRKQDRLTDDEFEQIKKHPEIGYHILSGLTNLSAVLPGVRNHHEAFNGSGYPDGLAGEQIPLMARIIAVADSYDAMGSDRSYRKGMPLEKLESILRQNSGPQWDPQVIDAYFRARVEIRKVWSAHKPTDLNSPDSGSTLICRRLR